MPAHEPRSSQKNTNYPHQNLLQQKQNKKRTFKQTAKSCKSGGWLACTSGTIDAPNPCVNPLNKSSATIKNT